MKKYILLNFAYGYGPFLRTTELALSINDELEKIGYERMGIIVPLAYGEKQKSVMLDAFGDIIRKNSDEIFFDKTLGTLLKSIFYGEKKYKESLIYYLKNYEALKQKISGYINHPTIHNYFDKPRKIEKKDITLEVNRCPRVSFGIEPSYYASFAYVSDIVEGAISHNLKCIDKNIADKIIPIYKSIEDRQKIHFIAEPATFSYLKPRKKKYKDETLTPPNIYQKMEITPKPEKGIYVTVTGIEHLDKIYQEAKNIGLKIYSNKPESIPGAIYATPSILNHDNILLHFARSGWGSIWLSQMTQTPFIAPQHDPYDDPEIYFNNLCIEKLGLGKVHKNQKLDVLLEFDSEYEDNVKKINDGLIKKYGTLNGVEYTAKKIVNDYIS